jgi:hypothetical protein
MTDPHHLHNHLTRRHFVSRLAYNGLLGGALIAISELVGTVGYHHYAGFSWVDSFLNASMLLSGMGPVGNLPNDDSKIFAALFALYSGLVIIALAGLMLGPVFHRVLHRFHLEGR